MIDVLAVFISFFTVIDPIGTVPVFVAVTASESEKSKRRIAIKAAFVAAVVLLIAMILMLAASWIHRMIGDSGASVVSRVMGLLLAAVAAENVLTGIAQRFGV